MREKVVIVDRQQNTFVTQSGYKVTDDRCTCAFFTSMKLPCKHIFKVLECQEEDLFVPSLCCERWTKSYYHQCHPALSGYDEIKQSEPIYVHAVRVPSEVDKYRKISKVSKEICNLGASMSTGQYEYFMDKVISLRNEMIDPNLQTDRNENALITNDTSTSTTISHSFSTVSDNNTPIMNESTTSSSMCNNSSGVYDSHPMVHPVASTSTNVHEATTSSSMCNSSRISSTHPFVHPVASTSTNVIEIDTVVQRSCKDDVLLMKLPPKLSSIGRPKGSGQTVIGLKRKVDKSVNSEATPAKRKFLDLGRQEQTLTLIQWLTNKSKTDIQKKKVTYSDIIQDPIMFNRLRNDGIDLDGLKKFVDNKCYKYLIDEVERLNDNQYWACAKCKKNLRGTQLMCNKCLDWFHLSCTEFKTAAATKNVTYFCTSCKA